MVCDSHYLPVLKRFWFTSGNSQTLAVMTSMASEAAFSSTSFSKSFTYQVFLSFRGEDTRHNFTDSLYHILCEKGINTFIDDKLPKGEKISAELVKAIKESEVSIIVFSEKYADSRWCLDELVEILQCKASNQQQVRSIFYKVDPSDVRHQKGKFGDAFNTLDQVKYKDSMAKWREALTDAADMNGWSFSDGGSEYQFISKIVKELSANVLINNLEVAKYPIGIDSRRLHVENLLDMENESVRMIGIWGPGGVGKSTIAKAVFNSIKRKFDASCFLPDVRSNSVPDEGLAKLQRTLLSNILGDSKLTVDSIYNGVSLIKTRMQLKRVLLVLDDVSELKQLDYLAPSIDCFGPGSRILITTRDQRWLATHEVNLVYEVEMMDDVQALQLFSRHAFKKDGPLEGYHELTQRAVYYAGGLPLALVVLGSHLFRRNKDEWDDTLDSCRGDHRTDIQKVLKISYDGLGDDLKEIFLDIACFFKGKYITDVQPVLEACHEELKPVIGLARLQEKSLIRIDRVDRWDVIWMHDLIEEMGQDIGKGSRLWNADDFNSADNTGTERLKGIQISHTYNSLKSFSEMKNLKYVYVDSESSPLSKLNIDYLSNELRWFEWLGCPLLSFPTNFSPRKLARLSIYKGCIKRLWEGQQILPFLKDLELFYCKSLVELPDLTCTPNLESLILIDCSSLVEIHHSMGALHKLVTLNVSDCTKLTALPKFIGTPNLEKLIVRRCSSLVEMHHSIRKLPKLVSLVVAECWKLTALPKFSGKMSFLRALALSGNVIKNLLDSNGTLSLPRLKGLDIRACGLSECDFLETLDCWDTLTYLNLSYNNIVSLPVCIAKFPKLEELDLNKCWRLREVPELPPNLVKVDASNCYSLERFWNLSEVLARQKITRIDLWDCCNLSSNIVSLEGLLLNIQANSPFSVLFPGTITAEDAKWLHCWKPVTVTVIFTEDEDEEDDEDEDEDGSWGSITISKNLKWQNLGLAVIAEFVVGMSFHCQAKIFINGVSIPYWWYLSVMGNGKGSTGHVWVLYIPLTVEMKAEVDNEKDYSTLPYYKCVVQFGHKPLKSLGVHLVCKESKDDENSSHKVAEEPIQQKRVLGENNASDFPKLTNKRHRRTKSV